MKASLTWRRPVARRDRRGFSLVETALAVAVVGVGIVGAIGLFPTGLEMQRRSLRDTLGTQFAAIVMEGLQAEMANRGSFDGLDGITIPVETALWSAEPSHVSFRTTPELVRLRDPDDPEIRIADVWYRLDWLPVHRLEQRTNVEYWDHLGHDTTGPAVRNADAVVAVPHPHMRRARLVIWVGADTVMNSISTTHEWGGRVQDQPDLRIPVLTHGSFHNRRRYRNDNAVFWYRDFYRYE